MAKSPRQKLKLLYIKDFLQSHSDENHPVSTADIIAHLASWDISAERKSIYDDIETLRLYGMDIIQLKGPGGGYYLASRDFELPELKLLVDAVQSSRFLTTKKSMQLIEKLSRKFGRTIHLECAVDPSLLGGLVVNVDGKVIDGSLKHRLQEIKEVMNR